MSDICYACLSFSSWSWLDAVQNTRNLHDDQFDLVLMMCGIRSVKPKDDNVQRNAKRNWQNYTNLHRRRATKHQWNLFFAFVGRQWCSSQCASVVRFHPDLCEELAFINMVLCLISSHWFTSVLEVLVLIFSSSFLFQVRFAQKRCDAPWSAIREPIQYWQCSLREPIKMNWKIGINMSKWNWHTRRCWSIQGWSQRIKDMISVVDIGQDCRTIKTFRSAQYSDGHLLVESSAIIERQTELQDRLFTNIKIQSNR